MTGAVRMAARAAFAAGAGLVHAVAPPETVAALVQAEPDLQTLAHPFDRPLRARHCSSWSARADAVVIGPGLGRAAGATGAGGGARASAARAVVLDADALVAFQGALGELRGARRRARPVVLTPHPGEFRALFPDLAARAGAGPVGRGRGRRGAVAGGGAAQGCSHAWWRSPGAHRSPSPPATLASPPAAAATCSAESSAPRSPQEVEPRHRRRARSAGARPGRRHRGTPGVGARSLRPMDVVAALPDLWREWELLRVRSPSSRPPVLSSWSASDARASPDPLQVYIALMRRRDRGAARPHGARRRGADSPAATGAPRTAPSSVTSAASPPSPPRWSGCTSPRPRRCSSGIRSSNRWEGPYEPSRRDALAGVFAALVDPLDQSLWLARADGWMHFQPELQLWDQGGSPTASSPSRSTRAIRSAGSTSAPAAAGCCCRAAAMVPTPGGRPRARARRPRWRRCFAGSRPCRPTPRRS